MTFVATRALFLAALVAIPIDSPRAAESIDLELILAIDVSGSVDEEEAQL